MKFYLGTHQTDWLDKLTDVPLFVSHRRLSPRAGMPVATTDWALDSGGFTELSMYGEWRTKPAAYVSAVRRYRDEIGRLEWASPQDWMCEPWIIQKTGRTVAQHQRMTVVNFLELRMLAPDLPFIPVLQGWDIADYHQCADLYERVGVKLNDYPVVGVGSVCRRQGRDSIATILESLQDRGLRLHGYGVKMQGVRLSSNFLTSADSMAWSFRARMAARDNDGFPGCEHKTCSSCIKFALRWRDRLMESLQSLQASR